VRAAVAPAVRASPAVAAAGLALAVLAAGCGSSQPPTGAPSGEITVFAASSLTEAFEELGARFWRRHGVGVRFNFLASSDLAAQIEQGAPADVLATADEASMERVVDAGMAAGEPKVFAHNKLEIVVPPGNPAGISSLEDLEDPELVISLCNEACPAGRYAREAFANAGVAVTADSLESEVKAVITRVALGEADAGIAYVTDVAAAGREVDGVPIADRDNVVATYPIVALTEVRAPAFADFTVSEEGQSVLEEHGFLPR
jgi:molybdate transport system substrate-binding protein